jgi:hypothetical protein
MSAMSNKVLDIQDAIVDNVCAPGGLTFEQIAENLNVPVDWVEAEYEAMVEEWVQ